MITLLSDFGTADYFVGAMKGALLTVCPSARAFDLTHDIPAHDIAAGAFTLWAAHSAWPVGTVHLAVVDPGVGSRRRAIIVEASGYYFVGPDNGLFSWLYENYAAVVVRHATNETYFRQPVHPSFHGRDVFAPLAGALACGVAAHTLGPVINDYVRLPQTRPQLQADGSILAHVIHLDRFGNCATSLTLDDFTRTQAASGFVLSVNGHQVTQYRPFFASETSDTTAPFVIYGSAGLWEISCYGASAAARLGVTRGAALRLELR